MAGTFFLNSQFNRLEEGWVFKLSEYRLKWNKRYLSFDFDKKSLNFYTDDTRRNLRSSYELTKRSTADVLTVEEKSSTKMMISLSTLRDKKETMLHFQTETREELDKWYEIFQESLFGILIKQPKLCSKPFHNAYPLKITFTVNQLPVEVDNGRKLDPHFTDKPPIVVYETATRKQGYFTLIFINPDAPPLTTDEKAPAMYQRDFVHWVVVNIPENDVYAGHTVCQYIPACPIHATGKQQYFFLLYVQERLLSAKELADAEHHFAARYGLKASEWATKAGLGIPVGCNGFQSEWTNFCDTIHEKIGLKLPEKYRSPVQSAKVK